MELFNKIGKDRCLILCLAGVLLVVIATPVSTFSHNKKEKTTLVTEDSQEAMEIEAWKETDSAESYAQYLENRVSASLSKMKGVGKTKVLVTVGSSVQLVVEKDGGYTRENLTEKETEAAQRSQTVMSDEQETIYVKDSEGNETPFVVQKIKPAVNGILVVCEGGDNQQVVTEVTQALEALFALDAHKIKVVKMKTE